MTAVASHGGRILCEGCGRVHFAIERCRHPQLARMPAPPAPEPPAAPHKHGREVARRQRQQAREHG
jgi:hypothetical protein